MARPARPTASAPPHLDCLKGTHQVMNDDTSVITIDEPTTPDTGDTVDTAQSDRAVYSVKEVAKLLGLTLNPTYALVRSGRIPAVKLGGRWVVPKNRFHAWLNHPANTGAPADAVTAGPAEGGRR